MPLARALSNRIHTERLTPARHRPDPYAEPVRHGDGRFLRHGFRQVARITARYWPRKPTGHGIRTSVRPQTVTCPRSSHITTAPRRRRGVRYGPTNSL
jgi:hypothetical protein